MKTFTVILLLLDAFFVAVNAYFWLHDGRAFNAFSTGICLIAGASLLITFVRFQRQEKQWNHR